MRHEFRANAGDLLYSFLVLDEIDIRRHGHHVGAYEVRDNRPDFADFRRDPAIHCGFGICDFCRGAGLWPAADRHHRADYNSRLFSDRPILQDLVDSYGQFNGPGGIHGPGSGDSPNQLFGPQFLPENGGGNPINFIGVTPAGGTNTNATTTSFTTPPEAPSPPVIAVTTPTQTLVINTGTAISGVSVTETGATSGEIFTVTVSDTHGILSVNTAVTGGGGTVNGSTSGGSGTSLTIVGTLSQVNADLTTLKDTDTTPGTDNITVTATDSLGHSATPQTINVTVNAPPPTAVASAITATEDTTYAFKVADFHFSDAVTPDTLGSVTITSLPSDGTLFFFNGTTEVAVTTGQVITAAEIAAGDLTLVPNTDTTTTGSFNFQVTDQAGQTLSANTAAMTVTITADAGPTAVASAVTATEDNTYAFKVADFKFTDSADTTPDTLGSVTITSLPSDGTLFFFNGTTEVAVTTGQVITAAEIAAGDLTLVPNTDTTTTGSFNFQVTDQAGQTLSANTAAMTVTLAHLTVAFTSESENEASETWTLKGTDSNTGGSGVQSVKVYLGSISTTNYLGTATLSNGTWTLTTPHNVPDSSHLTFVAVVTDNAGNTNTASVTVADPAGVAGNPINLALTDPSGGQATGPITLTFTGVPSDWSLNQGTNLGNGTWAVQTNDLSALTVLTAATYTGAMVLGVTETWTNANGSIGTATVADNVEAYAPGTPIFALSGNDTLTGAGGNNEYVFAQPIGNDTIYNFNAGDRQDRSVGLRQHCKLQRYQRQYCRRWPRRHGDHDWRRRDDYAARCQCGIAHRGRLCVQSDARR